ncbi:hypothetical protein [Methylobacterium oxalidis]|nr:hypothetical protein [Methylobacterium oxalidis]
MRNLRWNWTVLWLRGDREPQYLFTAPSRVLAQNVRRRVVTLHLQGSR